ncbi:MAG: RNA-guided pseudouridylation complex pseudouridine synthase subunit Cbf5 [Halobacteriales archaeon]|nr:RNA-guided pseudouridylation complex pseudouridine synthase subunit Cbf5 [Halobacteriales archaeon]
MSLRGPPAERDVESLLAFGVVNLDKPGGPTAHQVSAWVRDLTGVERAAHAGTLDPKVTGCLPVLTGDATRLAEALIGPKTYVAVLELHADPPADLEAVLAEFEGPILQKPPRKSAVSRRLRTREIYGLDALEVDGRQVLLRIDCEAGTYVRKLCHDLGLALGTGAHMGDLRRTAAEPFDDAVLVTLHDLVDALAEWRERGDEGPIREVVRPAERALAHLPTVTMAPSAAEQVAQGAPLYAPGALAVEGAEPSAESPPLVVGTTPDGAAVCLGRLVGDPDAESGTVVELERVLV